MSTSDFLSNLVLVSGITQIAYSCYSQISLINKLGAFEPKRGFSKLEEITQLKEDDSIIKCYHDLLARNIPCYLAMEKMQSENPSVLFSLFVFWVNFDEKNKPRIETLQEIKSGLIDSYMLNNMTANDILSTFPSEDLPDPRLFPNFKTQMANFWPLSLPNIKDLTELEQFLFGIRNLISRHISLSGAIPVGRYFLIPARLNDSVYSPDSKKKEGFEKFAFTFDSWLSNSSLYLRPTICPHPYEPLVGVEKILMHSKIVASPHGAPGVFLGYVRKIAPRIEKELVDIWSRKLEVSKDSFEPYYLKKSGFGSKFCYVRFGDSHLKHIFPRAYVFLVRKVGVCIENQRNDQKNFKLTSTLFSMASKTAMEGHDINNDIYLPNDAIEMDSAGPMVDLSALKYDTLIDSKSQNEVDNWVDSLSKNDQLQRPINSSKTYSLSNPIRMDTMDFGADLSGTNNYFDLENDFGFSNTTDHKYDFDFNNDQYLTDFDTDIFGSLQVTANDFDFFDTSYKDPVPPLPPPSPIPEILKEPTPPTLFEVSSSQATPMDHVGSTRPLVSTVTPLDSETIPTPILTNEFNLKTIFEENKLVGSMAEDFGAFTRNENMPAPLVGKLPVKYTTSITKNDPWIPDKFLPIQNLPINVAYLRNGKFTRLSKGLSKSILKHNKELIERPHYTASYCPAQYKPYFKRLSDAPSKIAKFARFIGPQTQFFNDKYASNERKLSEESIIQYKEQEKIDQEICSSGTSDSSKTAVDSGLSSDSSDTSDSSLKTEEAGLLSPNLMLPWQSESPKLQVTPFELSNFHSPGETNTNDMTFSKPAISYIPALTSCTALRIFMEQLRSDFSAPGLLSTVSSIDGTHPLSETFNFEFNLKNVWSCVLGVMGSLNLFLDNNQQSTTRGNAALKLEGPLKVSDLFHAENELNEDVYLEPDMSKEVSKTIKIQANSNAGYKFELDIDSVPFWKELELRPVNGAKNVFYTCAYSYDMFSLFEMEAFFQQLNTSYSDLNLGIHSPFIRPKYEHGLFPLPMKSIDYQSRIHVFAEFCTLIGKQLSKLPKEKLPEHMIFYLIAPHGPSDSTKLLDMAYCFRLLMYYFEQGEAKQCQVHFQSIPASAISKHLAKKISTRFFTDLSFNIYSRFYKFKRYMSTQIENLERVIKPSTCLQYDPAFTIAPPTPHFRLQPIDNATVIDHFSTVHLTYSLGAKNDYIIAVWMDECASLLDHVIIPLNAKISKAIYKVYVTALWTATRSFISRTHRGNVRLAVTKLGDVDIHELEAWKTFLPSAINSCFMCAGYTSGLYTFPVPNLTTVGGVPEHLPTIQISKLGLPLSRNVSATHLGVLNLSQFSNGQGIQVHLLFDTFNVDLKPRHIYFKAVLQQLVALATLDTCYKLPNSTLFQTTFSDQHLDPGQLCLPLAWRWVLSAHNALYRLSYETYTFT